MKLDKKQLPQLAILGVLAVTCVGIISFQVMKPSATTAPAAQQKNTKSAPASKTTVQHETQIVAVSTFPDLSTPAARRDPFIQQQLPGAENQPESTTSVQTRPKPAQIKVEEQTSSSHVVKNPSGHVPPIVPIGNFNAGSTTPPLAIQPVAVDEGPTFVLTGLIRGETNVAIIRMGNSERHIVKQGQIIDGRYKVISVSDDGAVLAYKNRLIHLKLGGVRNAS